MSKSTGLFEWLGEDKAEKLKSRVSQVESEIEENNIITRESEVEAETVVEAEVPDEAPSDEEDEEGVPVEGINQEIEIELDSETIRSIAESVAEILRGDLETRLESMSSEIAEIKRSQAEQVEEALEDLNKNQKIRFKIQRSVEAEAEDEEDTDEVIRSDNKQEVGKVIKNRIEALKNK